MKETKLVDWLVANKPNIINVGYLPGGEETYGKVKEAIQETTPSTPVNDLVVEREGDGKGGLKMPFSPTGNTREQLLLSDLTIVVNEKGDIIPIRVTNRSETVQRFVL